MTLTDEGLIDIPGLLSRNLRLASGALAHYVMAGLYLYGKEDVLSPVEDGYEQEDRLPAVRFFYPEDTGHQSQTDQPDLFNQVFLEFFRDGQVCSRTADAAGISKRRPELAALVARA